MGLAATQELAQELRRFARARPVYMAQVSCTLRSRHCGPGPYDVFLFPALDPGEQPGSWEISAAAWAMQPRSRGRVSLRTADPRVPPRIDHGFLDDPLDAEVVEEGFDRLRELLREPPLSRAVAAEVRPGPGVSAREHVRATARGFFHPTGTCAMGRVVDRDGRVLGQERLRVVDASIMPTVPRVNTHLPTVALAERIAAGMTGTV
jgi:choline dehydrogenase